MPLQPSEEHGSNVSGGSLSRPAGSNAPQSPRAGSGVSSSIGSGPRSAVSGRSHPVEAEEGLKQKLARLERSLSQEAGSSSATSEKSSRSEPERRDTALAEQQRIIQEKDEEERRSARSRSAQGSGSESRRLRLGQVAVRAPSVNSGSECGAADQDMSSRGSACSVSSATRSTNVASVSTLRAQAASVSEELRASQAREHANEADLTATREKMERMKRMMAEVIEEKNDMEDTMAGLKALHQSRIDSMKADAQQKAEDRTEDNRVAKDKANVELQKLVKSMQETSALRKRLEASENESKSRRDHSDILQRNIDHMRSANSTQLKDLRAELDEARMEFREYTDKRVPKSADMAGLLEPELAADLLEPPLPFLPGDIPLLDLQAYREDYRAFRLEKAKSRGGGRDVNMDSDAPATTRDLQALSDLALGLLPSLSPAHREVCTGAAAQETQRLRDAVDRLRQKLRRRTDELSEAHLQMMDMESLQQARQLQVGDLQMLLDEANTRAPSGPGAESSQVGMGRAPKQRGCASAGARRLARNQARQLDIIEELSDAGSVYSCGASGRASATVSEAGGESATGRESVADLSELDVFQLEADNEDQKIEIRRLEKLIADQAIDFTDLKERSAVQAAVDASKFARLLHQSGEANEELVAEHAGRKEYVEELLAQLASANRTIEESKETQLAGQKDTGKGGFDAKEVINSLQQRLCLAGETVRITEARMEEVCRAAQNAQRKYDGDMAAMRRQLPSCDDGSVDPDGSAALRAEVATYKEEATTLREERNMLQNTLEWKEVQWESTLEELRRQHAVDLQEMKQKSEEMQAELDSWQTRLSGSGKRPSPAVAAAADAGEPQDSPGSQSLLSKLKCPPRLSLIAGAPPKPPKPQACCQDVVWEVLGAVEGLVVLFCSAEDLIISSSSKSACATWGAAALRGESIVTLGNSPSRAEWLRQSFKSGANRSASHIPGFLIREFGFEEFTNRDGRPFDATVVAAHLPAEPAFDRSASWLVIFHPQAQRAASRAASSSARSASCSSSQGSAPARAYFGGSGPSRR